MAKTFFVISVVSLYLWLHHTSIDYLLYIGIGSLCVSILHMYDPFKHRPDKDLRYNCQCDICQSEPDPIFEHEAWEDWNEYWHGSLKKANKEWEELHSHVRRN